GREQHRALCGEVPAPLAVLRRRRPAPAVARVLARPDELPPRATGWREQRLRGRGVVQLAAEVDEEQAIAAGCIEVAEQEGAAAEHCTLGSARVRAREDGVAAAEVDQVAVQPVRLLVPLPFLPV